MKTFYKGSENLIFFVRSTAVSVGLIILLKNQTTHYRRLICWEKALNLTYSNDFVIMSLKVTNNGLSYKKLAKIRCVYLAQIEVRIIWNNPQKLFQIAFPKRL